jgi:hypothetical protein
MNPSHNNGKDSKIRRPVNKKESARKANLLKNPQPSRLHANFAEPLGTLAFALKKEVLSKPGFVGEYF